MSASEVTKLESDLACAICQELFIEPVTAECGHSFCRQCLNLWLKTKLSCPVCRLAISKVPVKCICLERAVEFVVTLSGDLSQTNFLSRKRLAVEETEEAKQCKMKLERDFESAVGRGAVMLQINREWSSSEKVRFCRGIQKHQNVPCFRESYCQVVGLTRQWIGRASAEALMIAANNVMLPRHDTEQTCLFQLRNRLEMFIQYG
ncbi:hypothetical protein BASA81_006429 [Batrachochytrium salamandrivorans]|nr:hypothetical protein BASA81_006429 [Batrachochytrium salamandrivorans]